MKTATTIIKNKVLFQLEKDTQFDAEKLNEVFWKKFANDFLNYETDPKPLYATIYSLELEDAEKVISKLPEYYSSVLKELAEATVLGTTKETTENLLKNKRFIKEVQFLKTMEQAIKNTERKRIKTDLPTLHNRLAFELSETDIDNVAKKKGREDLKAKMKLWDANVKDEPISDRSNSNKETSKSKVINLSWFKYAVAASILITAGVFYFNNNPFSKGNKIVKTDTIIELKNENLAAIFTDTTSSAVLQKTSLGFAPDSKKINIIFNNQQPRIVSINKAVLSYQKQLDTLLVAKKYDSITLTSEFNKRISALNKELKTLNKNENKYIFNGNVLTLFNTPSKENQLLLYEKQYYLYKNNHFFSLLISDEPQQFIIETDSNVLEALERIIFNNE